MLSDDGQFAVAGVPDTAMSWAEVAALALAAEPADDSPPGLYGEQVFQNPGGPAAFGTHISVVEVDTETGATEGPPPHRRRRLRDDPQPGCWCRGRFTAVWPRATARP